ncbi:hypothetical protein Leryth_017085, partial [Lithospermum erythrorhizon]
QTENTINHTSKPDSSQPTCQNHINSISKNPLLLSPFRYITSPLELCILVLTNTTNSAKIFNNTIKISSTLDNFNKQ